MTFRNLKWQWFAGAALFILFVSLLCIRLDLFGPSGPSGPAKSVVKGETDEYETWMQIFQGGRKIGYTHRTLIPGQQGYDFADTVFMRIKTMGVVQGVTLLVRGSLNDDMTLSKFHFRLHSNLFQFAARGQCSGRQLTLFIGEAGEEKKYELTLKDPPYLSDHISDAVVKAGLKPGEVKTLHIFDPASMGLRPVTLSLVGEEIRKANGKDQKLSKVQIDFLGVRQYAWLDGEGRVIREEGMLGLVLERATKEEALGGLTAGGEALADMTELVSVDPGAAIPDAGARQVLRMRIGRIEGAAFALEGGRQSFRDGTLTVRKEVLAKAEGPSPGPDPKERERLLMPSPFVQSDHPDIRAALAKIVSPGDAADVKMKKIVDWVYANLAKQPVLSVSNAVETLTQRKGDCTEHAVLVAALGRAAGIPATVETGLVYQRGRFYYHAWNVFWIEPWSKWITADAVFDQVPADVTHLRFARGEAQEQLDLVGLLGRIKLEIVK